MSRLANLSTAAVLAAVAAVLGLRFSEIAFLGWDAYPILAATGPGSEAGPLGVFGRPMADGLLPTSFYRPLLSLGVALEWPLWGRSAGGYLAANAVLFSLCGFVLHALLLRLGATRQMASAALLFFILHPVMGDVVPYLPRRPELLCTLFVLLALLLDHHGRFSSFRRPRFGKASWVLIVGAWLATAAAAGSKETAIVLPILIAAARLLFPASERHGSDRSPLYQAARGFAAHGAVLAAVLLFRFQVLGGLGGYPDSDVTQLPGLWLRTVAKVVLGVCLAREVLPAIGLAVLTFGIAAVAWRQSAAFPASRRAAVLAWFGPCRLRLAAFAAVWVLALATVYAAAARLSPWYLLIVVCGVALGFGLAVDLALSAISEGSSGRSVATRSVATRSVATRSVATRAAPVAVLLGGVLLLGSFAAGSPLFRPLEEYHRASRDSAAFLGELEERIRQSPAGGLSRPDRVEAGPYPRLVIGAGGRQVPVLVPHSLAGWARIVFPRRHIVFVSRNEPLTEPAPPGVTVVVLGAGIHQNLRNGTSE